MKVPIGDSGRFIVDFGEPRAARERADAAISRWAGTVDDDWLEGEIAWFSSAGQRDVHAPKRFLVTHFFNHQIITAARPMPL
jgi:uncharacterized damage-inducible protein DinB